MATLQQTQRMATASASRRSAMASTLVAAPACTSSRIVPQHAAFQPAMEAPRRASAMVARASAPAAQPAAAKGAASGQKEWYALVASADFFFNDPQNESLAEQLRERMRFFKEQGREADFYFVPEPKWLEAKYPEQAKLVKRPAVALVSTDKDWIVFMRLRLDRVLRFDMGAVSDAEVLAVGGKVPEFPAPAKWTAPYPPYTPGWWEVFFPKA